MPWLSFAELIMVIGFLDIRTKYLAFSHPIHPVNE